MPLRPRFMPPTPSLEKRSAVIQFIALMPIKLFRNTNTLASKPIRGEVPSQIEIVLYEYVYKRVTGSAQSEKRENGWLAVRGGR